MPPMTYLSRLRMEKAAALLRRTDMSAADIGRRVGYERPEHFSRRFHAHFHKTPGAYRAPAIQDGPRLVSRRLRDRGTLYK
mgnify:FL=1